MLKAEFGDCILASSVVTQEFRIFQKISNPVT